MQEQHYKGPCHCNLLNTVSFNVLLLYCDRSGFTGVNCEVSINECLYQPPICQNNGFCRDNVNGFECLCPGSNYASGYRLISFSDNYYIMCSLKVILKPLLAQASNDKN